MTSPQLKQRIGIQLLPPEGVIFRLLITKSVRPIVRDLFLFSKNDTNTTRQPLDSNHCFHRRDVASSPPSNRFVKLIDVQSSYWQRHRNSDSFHAKQIISIIAVSAPIFPWQISTVIILPKNCSFQKLSQDCCPSIAISIF